MGDTQSNRDKLLDAAEALFAEKGYDATTVREISRASGVALGLMSYYFGTKAELYVGVVQRRDEQHVADVLASIAAAEQNAGGRPLTVREMIFAFWTPILSKIRRDEGWRNYIRVLTRHTGVRTGSDSFTLDLTETHKVLPKRIIDTLRRNFPNAPEANIFWAYYILSSGMIHMLLENDRIDYVSDGLCKSDDFDAILASVASIFEHGLNGFLGSEAEPVKAPALAAG